MVRVNAVKELPDLSRLGDGAAAVGCDVTGEPDRGGPMINHEVSSGPLLAPENLALQHPFSIPLYADAPFGLGDSDEA